MDDVSSYGHLTLPFAVAMWSKGFASHRSLYEELAWASHSGQIPRRERLRGVGSGTPMPGPSTPMAMPQYEGGMGASVPVIRRLDTKFVLRLRYSRPEV